MSDNKTSRRCPNIDCNAVIAGDQEYLVCSQCDPLLKTFNRIARGLDPMGRGRDMSDTEHERYIIWMPRI